MNRIGGKSNTGEGGEDERRFTPDPTGDLRRSAPLRTLCERAKNAAALPCYVDTDRDLARLIDDEMRDAALTMQPDARDMLIPLLGGDRAAFEKAKPAFETSGAHIFYMGEVGAGSAMKLAQQVMVCINRMSGQEGMRLAEAYGLDMELVQQVVHTTGAQSQVTDNWVKEYKRMPAKDEDSARHMAHLFWKGLCPALELGHELGLSMPATALVQQTFPKVLGFE